MKGSEKEILVEVNGFKKEYKIFRMEFSGDDAIFRARQTGIIIGADSKRYMTAAEKPTHRIEQDTGRVFAVNARFPSEKFSLPVIAEGAHKMKEIFRLKGEKVALEERIAKLEAEIVGGNSND